MIKLIAVFALWLFSVSTYASDSISLSIGKWMFDAYLAENAQFDLTLTPTGLGLIAKADSLQLPAPIGQINTIDLNCFQLIIQAQQFSCNKGQLAFSQSDIGKQQLEFELRAKPEQNQYDLVLTNIKLADATIKMDITWQAQTGWTAVIESPDIQLAKSHAKLEPYLNDELRAKLSNWTMDGQVRVHTTIAGYENTIENVELVITAHGLNVSDSAGLYVTEDLAVQMQAKLQQLQNTWNWQSELAFTDGQAYADPVFLDVATVPFTLNGSGQWLQLSKQLSVEQFEFNQASVMQLNGQMRIDEAGLSNVELVLKQAELKSLYQHWLQPFLTGSAADDLELDGHVKLSYQQNKSGYQLIVGLDKVFVDDQSQRFGIDALSGQLAWTNTDNVVATDVSWQGGYVYAVPIGASDLHAEVTSSTLNLTQQWSLPVLDGELQLNQLRLVYPANEHATWSFDGLLTPISMESLSTALNWPLLHGKLSGVIPKVSYVDQKIDVDGALMVKLFEGTTIVRDLQLVKPFGALPQLYGNIDLVGWDLETLTRTFDFGKITGKLDGTVKNLRLSNWQPVQFDAQFATPEGDKSRRKISQRAVDNLSQIGGGASGVLSRSFLRFFEDFSYQRLGLSCKLLNNVCQMAGVGDTDSGYYIVKGGGLPPRINVVGYTRRVDWSDLIERLKAVQNSSGPVVQ